MVARIFKPARTATQSGRAKIARWQLDYEPEAPLLVSPLMGYTSSADMKREIKLSFATLDEAIGYAERHDIPYEVSEPNDRLPKASAYADNFGFGRRDPWTH
jgi:hypothetical protein